MSQPILKIIDVRPWWLRFILLAIIASPIFTHTILPGTFHLSHFFDDCRVLVEYACFVWLFVGLCVGFKQLLDWLAIGVIPALTVLMTGALFRSAHAWKIIHHLVPGASADPLQGKLDLIFKLLIIMISTPLALLFIASFPASNLMRWVSRQGATRTTYIALIGAIFLRMFQHVAEVVEKSMDAWKEENPSLYLPRHRGDWAGGMWQKMRVIAWSKASAIAWCKTITIQTLAAVPNIVRDFGRVLPAEPSKDKVKRAHADSE